MDEETERRLSELEEGLAFLFGYLADADPQLMARLQSYARGKPQVGALQGLIDAAEEHRVRR